MAQMIVIYRTPEDPAEFERHYFDVHVPLAKQLPGLRRYETSRGPVASMPGGDMFFVAILHFDSLADIRAAANTDVGRACAADRLVLAPGDGASQMLLFDTAAV